MHSPKADDEGEKRNDQNLLSGCGGLLALLSMSPAALRAATLETPFTFTVNEPVSVENTVLLPGTYLVKPVDLDAGVVMIFDKTGEHRIATSEFTNVERKPGVPETGAFTLYETAPGSVPALHEIFASSLDSGIEFPAPK